MGGNDYGESGHLTIFTLLKHLMMLLKYTLFSGLHFCTLSKTQLIACRAMQLRLFKVETLLNNAFNVFVLLQNQAVNFETLAIWKIPFQGKYHGVCHSSNKEGCGGSSVMQHGGEEHMNGRILDIITVLLDYFIMSEACLSMEGEKKNNESVIFDNVSKFLDVPHVNACVHTLF